MLHTSEQIDPPIRFLPFAEVKNRVGLSRSEIHRRMNDGRFPASVRLGTARVAWVESDIVEWQKEMLRAAGRSV